MGCYFLLQRIFPIQGSNLGLPHCSQMLYHVSHQGSQLLQMERSCRALVKRTTGTELMGQKNVCRCGKDRVQLTQISETKGTCCVLSERCSCQCRNAGDPGLIPGSGRSPGEGTANPLQYSCRENPMDRGDWRVTGVTKESDTT